MRFVKFFSILLVILLFLLSSCVRKEFALEIEESSSNKSLLELASKIYDEEELLEIVSFSSIDELNAQYPIDCIRKNSDIYRISYLGNSSIAVLLFDDVGNKLSGNIYCTQKMKIDFSGLIKGQSIEKVREIDPNGEYLFLYTGSNNAPKLSSHYTKDGYLIIIEYDSSNTIISIIEEYI